MERASVPEIVALGLGIVAASASPDALDALVVPGRAAACRIAEDELMLVCEHEVADEVAREVGTRLMGLEPDALVLATSDGWATVLLEGDDARAVFARLSRLSLPARGFVQGEVAHIPARILVEEDRIHIIVRAALGQHVRSRISAAAEVEPSR
jgi:hypothetical protein